MKLLKYILFVILLFVLKTSLSQDTVVVVRNKWKTVLKKNVSSFIVKNDSIFEQNGRTSNYDDYKEFVELTSKNNYFYFINKDGQRIMECFWTSESVYGTFITYYKTGAIKVTGQYYDGGKCGKWVYYKKNKKVKKSKEFQSCFTN